MSDRNLATCLYELGEALRLENWDYARELVPEMRRALRRNEERHSYLTQLGDRLWPLVLEMGERDCEQAETLPADDCGECLPCRARATTAKIKRRVQMERDASVRDQQRTRS